jgi:hypothetical protein
MGSSRYRFLNKTASNLITVAEGRANAPRCDAEKRLGAGLGACGGGSGFRMRENGRWHD